METENKPICIIVIDDNAEELRLFSSAIESIDHTINCLQFSSGKDAIRHIMKSTSHLPDYIFCDIKMPGLDGIDCLRKIKEIKHAKDIPVIMYSSVHPDTYQQLAKRLGAAECLQKQIDFYDTIDQLTLVMKTVPSTHHH
jgi:CheY-like chemotaxis protein